MKRPTLDEKRQRVMAKRQKLINKLKRYFSKRLKDIGTDVIDFEALCDGTLSYGENISAMLEYITTTSSLGSMYKYHRANQNKHQQNSTNTFDASDNMLDDW
jgi:hypothetical protein